MPMRPLLQLVAGVLCASSLATVQAAEFLHNGVTAHRGNSVAFPENTMAAFRSGIEVGADWIELDLFRSKDGQLVVIHDATTGRVGDRDLAVADSNYAELAQVDVATGFRRKHQATRETCPPRQLPLLKEVLKMVMQQRRTRVSLQPKMDCIAQAWALIEQMGAQPWVGFNDGNLAYMAAVKRLAPEIPVFWDRGAETDLAEDLRMARQHGFESLVYHHAGITAAKIARVQQAGLEVGAWTVNDPAMMKRFLEMGIDRIYTDAPLRLLVLQTESFGEAVRCEGTYPHHLQGVCVDDAAIYWSFTTRLVKTDRDGERLREVTVPNHHGDLCYADGELYVAVNLGKFNDPEGNADSWVYVYDAGTLDLLRKHETQQVFHGAGGIGVRGDHFYVVGGLPDGVPENYVYEYDRRFRFLAKHVIASGHTLLGIQAAAFAKGRWWFGCYGSPPNLLVTDEDFQLQGRYEYACALGIVGLPGGRLLAASGNCQAGGGCTGEVRMVVPDPEAGLRALAGKASAEGR